MNQNIGTLNVAKPGYGMKKSKGYEGKKTETPAFAKKGTADMTKPKAAPKDDYETRDDARALIRAHLIKGDKKRHEKAKAHIAAHVHAMKNAASEESNETGYAGPNTNGDEMAGGLGV